VDVNHHVGGGVGRIQQRGERAHRGQFVEVACGEWWE
jgi:hypothetical protein